MASDVEMSLEEIIKKKKVPFRNTAASRPHNANQRQNTNQPKAGAARVGDARNKIILKRRTQIADLRDKLAEINKQKDVRVKLEQLRMRKSGFRPPSARNIAYNNIQENRRQLRNMTTNMNRAFTDLSRQVSSRPLPVPPKFNINRQIGYSAPQHSAMHSDRIIPAGYRVPRKPILRTVENDVYLPKPIVIEDEYEPLPLHPRASGRAAALNLKIFARNDAVKEKSPVLLRNRTSERREERVPQSILKKRPMAALRMDRERRRPSPPPSAQPASPPPTSHSPPEYRIVVSNLRSSVSGTDIQELFGDVGGLVESRLVRPGTAEVMYGSLEDAQRAVDLYHNRQLDGQPMNCLLVNPRTTHTVATSGRLGASSKPSAPPPGASSVVPDIDTFHKVLFSRH